MSVGAVWCEVRYWLMVGGVSGHVASGAKSMSLSQFVESDILIRTLLADTASP